jgi:sporulation protein YlmC with PRC-barrel domain
VLDPVRRAITHLVVEPRHRRNHGHLVPIGLVQGIGAEIRLSCTRAEFDGLDQAEDRQFIQGPSGHEGYAGDHVLTLPYYGLGAGLRGVSSAGIERATGPHLVTTDHVPLGEVEVRRGESVHATDGEIGRVKGLVIDPDDHQVTHFLLDDGHLWGHKLVAIPIGAVTRVGDGVRLSLTRDEVRDLPPVEVDAP